MASMASLRCEACQKRTQRLVAWRWQQICQKCLRLITEQSIRHVRVPLSVSRLLTRLYSDAPPLRITFGGMNKYHTADPRPTKHVSLVQDNVSQAYAMYRTRRGKLPFVQWHDRHAPPHRPCNICKKESA